MESEKRFTDNAKAALAHAEVLARLSKSSLIETSHLLLAIASQDESEGSKALREFGVSVDDLRKSVGVNPGVVVTTGRSTMRFSDAMQLTIQMAIGIADEFQSRLCGTEHMLFCLLTQRHSRAVRMLDNQSIDTDELSMRLAKVMHEDQGDGEGVDFDDDEYNDEPVGVGAKRRSGGASSANRQSCLAKYATDLTEAARNGQLDPVIGRDREIERLITILSRRTKNNPVLTGAAGVGKTAVVEGLAQRIANHDVPELLANKRLMELDLAAMVAGTKYRGEFEDRLKQLVHEVSQDDSLIIFIDEVHLLVGAGSAEGAMDAANLLKPALARGKFHMIGATTTDEYRKHIEKDAALARRMQAVIIEAPSASDTMRILAGLAPRYEEYHNVSISGGVIEEIVRLSERYLTERQQPDKAIDVLDETAARVRVSNAGNDQMKELQNCQVESDKLAADMERAVAAEDYENAALYKMRISQLREKIDELQAKQAGAGRIKVRLNDVAATVSRMTGVPLEQLKRSEIVKLASLEKNLGRRVIGQEQAVAAVSRAIRRSRAGIADPGRPIGSFIFLGPTGVGKTELARVLADEVFGSRNNLIKVDMSEFSEKHTVSRLVGAPAGYVGYDDGGQLTERVRRQPYSVVLFDEIEKAHPDVFNILLQILEDGVLTDGHGKKVDFRNCVIILTSNIGAAELSKELVGFTASADGTADNSLGRQEIVMRALRNTMRPELINRFDQIVLFNDLGDKEISAIFELMLADLNKRLANKGVSLSVTTKLKKWLIAKGYDRRYGARPMRRAIQDNLECVVADQIISGQIRRGDIVRADLKDGQVVLTQQVERSSRRKLCSKNA